MNDCLGKCEVLRTVWYKLGGAGQILRLKYLSLVKKNSTKLRHRRNYRAGNERHSR